MDEQRVYNSLERLNDKQDAQGERLTRIETSVDGLRGDLTEHVGQHDRQERDATEKWRDFRDTGFKCIAAVGGVGGLVAYLRLFVFGG